MPRLAMDGVLVGPETADDAGAVRLGEGTALLATVDFITPLVDDPMTFGAIAAANAVSDVYAMGGRPVGALSVACFPVEGRGAQELAAVLRGGALKLGEAATPVIGGHTVEDPGIKVGYAVFGTAHPARLWRNSTARPGDELILTKPLGTGILAAAARARKPVGADWDAAVRSMTTLNRAAAEAVDEGSVRAATDITGFGLLGHVMEMARGAGVSIVLDAAAIPVLDGALRWASAGCLTNADRTNRAHVGADVRFEGTIERALDCVLHDPQTSGGLLLAVASASEALRRLESAGVAGARVGEVGASGPASVTIMGTSRN